MRAFACVAVVFVLGLIGACTLPGADTTSSTGTVDAGPQCSQNVSCDACLECAQDGPCGTLYTSCMEDSDCAYVLACAQPCGPGDTACRQACVAENPNGESGYQAFVVCLYCQQCTTACAGQCEEG